MFSLLHVLDRFRRDRHGTFLIVFSLTAAVIMMFCGAALDVALAVHFRNALQVAVDKAALAGAKKFEGSTGAFTSEAAAKESMAESLPHLPPNDGVAFTVSPFATDAEGTTTVYNCRVVATGKVRTTLLSVLMEDIQVSVAATAVNGISSGDEDLASAGDDPLMTRQGPGAAEVDPVTFLEVMAMGPAERIVRLTQ